MCERRILTPTNKENHVDDDWEKWREATVIVMTMPADHLHRVSRLSSDQPTPWRLPGHL